MSDYFNSTEEQQFNEAKNWFKKNGTPILVAICVLAGSSFGWQYWKKHQIEVAQQASENYQQVMESYLQNPEKNAPLVAKFVAENKNAYSVFAELEQVKQAADKGDFATAKSELEQALAGTEDPTLQTIIRFRLALTEYQLANYDGALAVLANVKDAAWEQRKQLLVGDILAAKGDKTAARSAYEQAKGKASEQDKMLIDIRLNNL